MEEIIKRREMVQSTDESTFYEGSKSKDIQTEESTRKKFGNYIEQICLAEAKQKAANDKKDDNLAYRPGSELAEKIEKAIENSKNQVELNSPDRLVNYALLLKSLP